MRSWRPKALIPAPPDVDVTGSIPKAQSLTPVEQKEISRAQRLIKIGDIAGARLVFEHALRGGNRLMALHLAETYDSERLAAWGVVGMRADEQKARELYQRAADGGIRIPRDR